MDWRDKLSRAVTIEDRLQLAYDPDCDIELLNLFIRYDAEPSIIIAAAIHPNSSDAMILIAAERIGWSSDKIIRKKRASIRISWYKRLQQTNNVFEREDIAKDPTCHVEILEMFVKQDIEPSVVIAAATNPNCPSEIVEIAADRTNNNYDELIAQRRININELYKDTSDSGGSFSDRDSIIVSHILNKDNQHAEMHLGNYEIIRTNKTTNIEEGKQYKEHIVLIMCPAWGIVFPPYNLARLTGLLRHNGYKVTVFDLNIESYYVLKDATGINFWSSEKYHLWFQDRFVTDIWPHIKEMITNYVNKIGEINPDIIGFSLYNTNMCCSNEMMQLLRNLLPDTPIIVGGPEASQDTVMRMAHNVINYIFKGEAEHTLLTFLENKEYSAEEFKYIGNLESKLPLDDLPFPDYSDYIIEEYMHPDGVSIETSRGCIAQCSFCSETWFWKFRQRTPERVIEEMKDQISKYGIKRFWFVDSLVNGNIKEFRRLVDLIIENELNIRWNSYARNDGRMDRDFIFKIAESGCTSLSFGVESGSQKVLNDMRKKIELWEIEQNLKDCYDAGMSTHINWMIGFPTEENIDFVHGMVLIANTAKYFHAISPGMGCGPATFSDLERAWKLYKITWKERPFDTRFLGHWFTEGYQNTQLHRVIRIKIFAIFLNILRNNLNISPNNGQQYDDIKKFYTLTLDNTPIQGNVPKLDNLNFNFWESNNNDNIDDFAAHIANEYPGIMWILFKLLNCGFKLTINFDPAMDTKNFGAYIAVNYKGTIIIKVDENGNYNIIVNHELLHEHFNPILSENILGSLENEKITQDKSFKKIHAKIGNLNELIVKENLVKETIHVQYRNKRKSR